jgi:hypothetical protein
MPINPDMFYNNLIKIYKKIGRIQAREKLLLLSVSDLKILLYFLHESTDGSKNKLVDRVMNHLDIQYNLTKNDSVKFFDF